VQFIPVGDKLEHSAVNDSKTVNYGKVKTKILKAEYLIAIALKVGRGKDLEKISRLMEQAKINKKNLKEILKKHNLLGKFSKWEKRLK